MVLYSIFKNSKNIILNNWYIWIRRRWACLVKHSVYIIVIGILKRGWYGCKTVRTLPISCMYYVKVVALVLALYYIVLFILFTKKKKKFYTTYTYL